MGELYSAITVECRFSQVHPSANQSTNDNNYTLETEIHDQVIKPYRHHSIKYQDIQKYLLYAADKFRLTNTNFRA